MAIAKLVQPSTVQYDSQKDFQPISLIGTSPLVLAGKKDLPANTTDEGLIKLGHAPNPGKAQATPPPDRHLPWGIFFVFAGGEGFFFLDFFFPKKKKPNFFFPLFFPFPFFFFFFFF